MKRLVAALATVAAVAGGAGCDKIKSLAGKGDDAGASSSGGGVAQDVLSFLGGTFEGEITMGVTTRGQGGPRTLVFGMKDPKVRIDATGGVPGDNPVLAQGASFILDPPQKKGYALVPSQKKAMVLDFEKMKSGQGFPFGGKPGAPSVPDAPPKIEKTGKKDVVAGYACEVWVITTKSNRSEVCSAEGIKWINLVDLGMSSPELAAAAALGDVNRFPLRIVSFDASGAEEVRLEAKKIEKKEMDASRFEVPPDYQVIDLSALMGGFGVPGAKGLPSGFVPPAPPPRKR